MRLDRTVSVEELQVVSRFEGLRQILLAEAYADHLHKPLAFWALPTDRRLPLAFLGRTLRDLLSMPFVELSGTPGIGRKKMAAFVQLLARAAKTDPAELPTEILNSPSDLPPHGHVADPADSNGFDPTNISEVTWAQWRASVVRHGLTGENLGRLPPVCRT